MRLRRLFFAIILLVGFTALPAMMLRLPLAYVPWGKIDLRADVGWFTGHKIAALRNDEAACHIALREVGIDFNAVTAPVSQQCPLENMAVLNRSSFPYSAPVRANCGLIAAMVVWEAKVVAPAAQKHFAAKVSKVNHLGIFSCRNVRGSNTRQSEHAHATAIDISAFTLSNGQQVSVQRDWGADSAAGRFLRDVRDGSCPIFRAVLGPEYNALHRDHFHLDLGRYNICR